MTMTKIYSLYDIFGNLPVSPTLFATLDPKLKWLGKAVEGSSWCVTCGTLTPSIPNSHHIDCCSYDITDSYPEYVNEFGDCPSCGNDDSLYIESSRELQVSRITCSDCSFIYSDSVDEVTLTENYKNYD